MDYDNTQTLQSLHLDIPEEIIEEIMYRLPAKSLMRFKSVSKSWRTLIDSDRFIKNHYRINSTSLAHHRVIFNWPCWGLKQCSLQSILDRACTRPFHLDKEMDNDELITRYSLVIGCCKGLLCLVFAGVYTLWNPATNVSFCLPDIPRVELSLRVCEKHGFGWDETSDAYKVFALSSDDHNEGTVARVYSSKTNSWKTLVGGHGSLSTYNYTGMYACGSFHWVTAGCEEIECFELKSEAFRKMEMPSSFKFEVKYKGYEGLRLGEVRGCLSVMRERMIGGVVDLWAMKNESWPALSETPTER